MHWLINTSLLKVICRGAWLCKLTYPVIYRLTVNRLELPQISAILNVIWKQLPSTSAIRTTIYEMAWSLTSVLTLHGSVQLKLNSDVNCAKQNGIRWCQQCNKPGTIGRVECDLLKCYELRTNYVKNTTSVSSSTWNKSLQLNIQTKNTYKRNNSNIACQLLHQSRWKLNQNEVTQNSNF